jgi:transposase InsO family protein
MPSERKTRPIRRSGRKAGEDQARQSRPRRYRAQWSKDVTSPPAGLQEPRYASIDEVPADLRERAVVKSLFVSRYVEEGCPRGRLFEYAQATATAIDHAMPPSTTLRGWAKQYQHWGLLGLVDKVRADAGRSRTVVQGVREIALVCVVGARHGTTQALAVLQRLVPDAPLPTYDALWREIERFKKRHPHLMALVREGITGWRNRFRLALPGAEFPGGYRYAVDSTVCDLWVRVRNVALVEGWEAIRCVLTVVEDVGSRTLLTFNLSLVSVDSGIAIATLRRAIMPGENYAGLPQLGLPHEVIVDKGPEHLGSFYKSLGEVGVAVTFARTPEDNGRIERVIDTISTQVFASLPSYAKSQRPLDPYATPRPEDRKKLSDLKYDPYHREIPLELLLTIEELEARIHAWATVYNDKPHKRITANSQLLQEALELDRLIANPDTPTEEVA